MYIYSLKLKDSSFYRTKSDTLIITEDEKQFSQLLEKERKDCFGYDCDLTIEVWDCGSLVFDCTFNTYYYNLLPSSALNRFYRWQENNI